MADKFNYSKRSKKPQPYDHKLAEPCPSCSGKMVYRKRSYFGQTTYYKVCNQCGLYQVLDEALWKEIVTTASQTRIQDFPSKSHSPNPGSAEDR